MDTVKIKNWLKKFWHFIWEDESIWSWIANIVLAFVLIKWVVYPFLGFVFGTGYPIVAVVSGSMEHGIAKDDIGVRRLCGNTYSEWHYVRFDEYWEACGKWYEGSTVITREDFLDFPFHNGFNEGDIMIVFGKKPSKINIGDVIVFKSKRPDPIIHRVVRITQEDGAYYFQTKGDHNENIIKSSQLDESKTHQDYVLGNAVIRVPYLGWVKILFVELLKMVMG